MIYPSREVFIQLSRSYEQVTVVLETEMKEAVPVEVYRRLYRSSGGFLLESREGGHFSYLGKKPECHLQGTGELLRLEGKGEIQVYQQNLLKGLEAVMDRSVAPFTEAAFPPFLGGAVGYLAYDLVRQVEKLPQAPADPLAMPDLHLMLADQVVAFDHRRQRLYLAVTVAPGEQPEAIYGEACDQLAALEAAIHLSTEPAPPGKAEGANTRKEAAVGTQEDPRVSDTREAFMEKVKQAKEYIRNGDIFQVVLSRRMAIPTGADPFEAYLVLREMNPSPYLFYLDFGSYQLVGASPELLVKLEGGMVETCPIAGTRPRGKTPEEDRRLAEELLKDPKERAEHLMLVDLARNDIGKLAEFGSVEMTEWMEVKYFSHVMHLVSRVRGRLKAGLGMLDCVRACLPAGTLSGAPKVRAMEIINELETEKRGAYGGAVGFLGYQGNMDLCITIRTILFRNRRAYVQTGAGIVADSQPESEYEEVLRKAGALVETLKRMEGMA